MSQDNQAPRPSEIEFSIFGPGFGECALLHLGEGQWLIVDSCVDQRRREQPALAYLNRIGVDAAQAVKLVVATHWHDDHIRGLGQVVSACATARFACPVAFRDPELLTLIGVLRNEPFREQSGTTEITRVFQSLRERGRSRVPPIIPVISNRVLLDELRGDTARVRVVALSPSDAAVVQAAVALKARAQGGSLTVAPSPNLCSVVLHVSFPSVSLLLGADLEETADPSAGWSAVVDLIGRPRDRAQVFKVPHHGSGTGHHDRVWAEMLEQPIYAVLTPFVRLRTPLPSPDDINRIVGLSNQAYITSMPVRPSAPRREPAVERQLREMTRRMALAEPVMGHIRFRRELTSGPGGSWSVDLDGAAQRLSSRN